MTPNRTNGRRNIDKFAFRVSPIRARIWILRKQRCRNQASSLMLVHKNATSQAGVGDHFRIPSGAVRNSCLGGRGEAERGHHDEGNTVDTGPVESQSVYNSNIIENHLSLALLGESNDLEHLTPQNIKVLEGHLFQTL